MTPILFVQGTGDALCPLDVLVRVRGEMRAANELHKPGVDLLGTPSAYSHNLVQPRHYLWCEFTRMLESLHVLGDLLGP